jgi:sulfide:quinone oxidoreductase
VVRQFDLFKVANDLGAELVVGAVERVDAPGHTVTLRDGTRLNFDALLIASGASARESVPGAIAFGGPADVDRMRHVVTDIVQGRGSRLLFALPAGVGWTLPLYELCLIARQYLSEQGAIYRYPNQGIRRQFVEVGLVSPEDEPLEAFGTEVSRAISDLFAERGIIFYGNRTPVRFHDGQLETRPGEPIAADRVVAMPRLHGETITGIPADANGLIRTDAHGRVIGLEGVYAAGDITAFPIKQGGMAAQQAVAAAQSIAANAGVDLEPAPFDPVLRAVLLTGTGERYLRSEVGGGHGMTSTLSEEPLWWPPGKVVARYLTAYLAELDSDPSQVF